jgi:hypothetical protein
MKRLDDFAPLIQAIALGLFLSLAMTALDAPKWATFAAFMVVYLIMIKR